MGVLNQRKRQQALKESKHVSYSRNASYQQTENGGRVPPNEGVQVGRGLGEGGGG